MACYEKVCARCVELGLYNTAVLFVCFFGALKMGKSKAVASTFKQFGSGLKRRKRQRGGILEGEYADSCIGGVRGKHCRKGRHFQWGGQFGDDDRYCYCGRTRRCMLKHIHRFTPKFGERGYDYAPLKKRPGFVISQRGGAPPLHAWKTFPQPSTVGFVARPDLVGFDFVAKIAPLVTKTRNRNAKKALVAGIVSLGTGLAAAGNALYRKKKSKGVKTA